MSSGRILVVDDEPQILRALKTNLTAAGYVVETAATGEEALALAAMKPPDALILDLVLPDRSGTDVTRELRTWTSVPIVVETFTFLDRNTTRTVALTWKDSLSSVSRLRVLPCTTRDLDRAWIVRRVVDHLGGAARREVADDSTPELDRVRLDLVCVVAQRQLLGVPAVVGVAGGDGRTAVSVWVVTNCVKTSTE